MTTTTRDECETCGGDGELSCPSCAGTGEGMADGARCMSCRGSGSAGACPDCTPEQDDGSDYDEEAAVPYWKRAQYLREYGEI